MQEEDLLAQEEDLLLAQEEELLRAQEEDKEWSPEKWKMVKKHFSQNCPGTFGVPFAIITGT